MGSPFFPWPIGHQATRTKGTEAPGRAWLAVSMTERTFLPQDSSILFQSEGNI